MEDKVSIEKIKLLHTNLRSEALEIYKEVNKNLNGKAIFRVTHTLRTYKEQDDLYAIGRTKPGKIVTNAKGGESFHNFGLALDFCLLVDKDGNGTYETAVWDTKSDYDNDNISDWQEVIKIFTAYGWECGINWKFIDPPHVQKSFGYSVKQLQKLQQGVGNAYVNL